MSRYTTGEVYLNRDGGNFPYYFFPIIGGVRAYRDMRREGASRRTSVGAALFSQIPTGGVASLAVTYKVLWDISKNQVADVIATISVGLIAAGTSYVTSKRGNELKGNLSKPT